MKQIKGLVELDPKQRMSLTDAINTIDEFARYDGWQAARLDTKASEAKYGQVLQYYKIMRQIAAQKM